MIRITGDDGKSAEFALDGREEWGDVRILFSFGLGWMSGKVRGSCSGNRISELAEAVRSLAGGAQQDVSFINDDGNIEFSLKLKPTGRVELAALAIPDMAGEDRASFSFEGILSMD